VIDEECPECGRFVCDWIYSEPKQQSEGKRGPGGERYTNIAESDDGRAEDKWENERRNERGRRTGWVPFLENRSKIPTPRHHAEANEGQEKRVWGVKGGRGRGDIGVSVR